MIWAAVFLAGFLLAVLLLAFAWVMLDTSSVRRGGLIDLTGMRRDG